MALDRENRDMTKTFKGQFDWQDIMNEAKCYKYVVMYRDHYPGNGKGEYFRSEDFELLMEHQSHWFNCTERPLEMVILTNDDVPDIINERKRLIDLLQTIRWQKEKINVPAHPDCDGRATRRTQPEAYAKWDAEVAQTKALIAEKKEAINRLQAQLNTITYYSSTLYRI